VVLSVAQDISVLAIDKLILERNDSYYYLIMYAPSWEINRFYHRTPGTVAEKCASSNDLSNTHIKKNQVTRPIYRNNTKRTKRQAVLIVGFVVVRNIAIFTFNYCIIIVNVCLNSKANTS